VSDEDRNVDVKVQRGHRPDLNDNRAMSGIQVVTDDKGRKVAVQIDLKKHGQAPDFCDGSIPESRRKQKGVPLEKVKADLIKRGRLRGKLRGKW
jgi:hypothetical protein